MPQSERIITVLKFIFSHFYLKALFSCLFGYIVYLLGYDKLTIEVLSYLIIIDWIFGVASAIINKKFSSWHLSKTLYKVFFYLLLLIAVHQAQRMDAVPEFIDKPVEFFLVFTELTSIVESFALLGFVKAKKLAEWFNNELDNKLTKK